MGIQSKVKRQLKYDLIDFWFECHQQKVLRRKRIASLFGTSFSTKIFNILNEQTVVWESSIHMHSSLDFKEFRTYCMLTCSLNCICNKSDFDNQNTKTFLILSFWKLKRKCFNENDKYEIFKSPLNLRSQSTRTAFICYGVVA